MPLKMGSQLAQAIGYTSDNFEPMGSLIWDLWEAHGFLAIMSLNPKPGAQRPIANLIERAERLNIELRFCDFPQHIQDGLMRAKFEKVVERCGSTYLHNRTRLKARRG